MALRAAYVDVVRPLVDGKPVLGERAPCWLSHLTLGDAVLQLCDTFPKVLVGGPHRTGALRTVLGELCDGSLSARIAVYVRAVLVIDALGFPRGVVGTLAHIPRISKSSCRCSNSSTTVAGRASDE